MAKEIYYKETDSKGTEFDGKVFDESRIPDGAEKVASDLSFKKTLEESDKKDLIDEGAFDKQLKHDEDSSAYGKAKKAGKARYCLIFDSLDYYELTDKARSDRISDFEFTITESRVREFYRVAGNVPLPENAVYCSRAQYHRLCDRHGFQPL